MIYHLLTAKILLVIVALAIIVLLGMAVGKAIKYLTGPEFINDDCMMYESYGEELRDESLC